MAIENIGRIVVAADTQSNIEALTGFDLGEMVFGVDTDTGKLGFSTDSGATWTWITSATAPVLALDDLTDVTITSAVNGQLLQYNGSAWVNVTPSTSSPEILVTGAAPIDALTNEAGTDWIYGDK